MKMISTLGMCAVLLAGACKQTDKKEPAAEPAKPVVSDRATPAAKAPTEKTAEPQPELSPDKLSWSEETVDSIGLTVPVIDGVEAARGGMNDASYIRQQQKPLMASVWYGPGRTVEAWRAGYENNPKATLGDPETIEICGKKAIRQEVTLPAMKVPYRPTALEPNAEAMAAIEASAGKEQKPRVSEAERAKWQDQGYREVPARTSVAVGFSQGGTDVIATWIIDSDKRDAFRAAEAKFLAGFRCGS